MLARLADKFILKPTRHPIPVERKTRRQIDLTDGQFEVWVEQSGDQGSAEPDLFILKFPGTGGRAERATLHPAEVWSDLRVEVWTVNPPGYGGSGGRASVQHIAAVSKASFREIFKAATGRPLVVAGNSLGTLAALYLAALHDVDALLLRNPPPLRQLIAGQYARWSFGLSRLIARQVPDELCSIRNAARTRAPAVFVTSEKDSMVPQPYQRKVFNAYAGENRIMMLRGADHACPIAESQRQQYLRHLAWLRKTAIEDRRKRTR